MCDWIDLCPKHKASAPSLQKLNLDIYHSLSEKRLVHYACTLGMRANVIITSLNDSAQHHTLPFIWWVQLFWYMDQSRSARRSFVLSFARRFYILSDARGMCCVREFSITESDIFDSVPLRCDRSASSQPTNPRAHTHLMHNIHRSLNWIFNLVPGAPIWLLQRRLKWPQAAPLYCSASAISRSPLCIKICWPGFLNNVAVHLSDAGRSFAPTARICITSSQLLLGQFSSSLEIRTVILKHTWIKFKLQINSGDKLRKASMDTDALQKDLARLKLSVRTDDSHYIEMKLNTAPLVTVGRDRNFALSISACFPNNHQQHIWRKWNNLILFRSCAAFW